MAFSLSQHCLVSPPSSSSSTFQTPPKSYVPSPHLNFPLILQNNRRFISIIPKSIQQSQNNENQLNEDNNNTTDTSKPEGVEDTVSTTELGEQIKKAMKEREEKVATDFWSGVGEEIREIEWPAFNKVLGTTGVVLGVIAGSSLVLLTVNAVLAELSDTVFAGKGVQDFFS